MAINFTDFSRIPTQESPLKNIFEDVLKGYQIEEVPKQMAQEKKQRELANSLQELALKHKPKEYALSDALKQAQLKKVGQPAGATGALANAFKLRQSLDPSSPTYEADLGRVNNYIDKLGKSGGGIQFSTTPEGGINVSIGGEGESQQATIPGFPALPKGQTYLFDENKKPIGIGKPYTAAEAKEEAGRKAFNIYQKFITDAHAPYSGKGASRQFNKDVENYATDEAAKTRIDNMLAADKLLFSATVKEEATLGGANTNQAYKQITSSLKNSEVYPLLKRVSKYRLPPGYSKSSSDIFNTILNQGTQAGKMLPAYKAHYFNPKETGAEKPSTKRVYNLATRKFE